MTLPYENATSGERAIREIEKILIGFGCSKFGSMMDFEKGELLYQFEYEGKMVMVKASINGYAAAWLKEHPYSSRIRVSREKHKKRGRDQAMISVYSILRDWIKGQMAAIDTGMLTFEGAFLGQFLLDSGKTVLEECVEREMIAIPESVGADDGA